jgi:hypothetical protein
VFDDIKDLIWVNASTPPIEIILYLYLSPVADKFENISKFPAPDFVDKGCQELLFRSTWSIPTRAEMESYRRQSSIFNAQAMSVMVDEPALSDCVVTHHMKGLYIDGKEVDLERKEDLSLTVESLQKLKSMHSGLYDLMYGAYKVEACLFT